MKTGRARAREAADAQGTVSARTFAGLSLEYEFFVERVTPPRAPALDRWKKLEEQGWDVTALVDEQATTMVGLGFRYQRCEAA